MKWITALRRNTKTKKGKRTSRRGFVYLLKSPSGAYKIGRTKNPKDRKRTFNVKLPFEIEFISLIKTPNMVNLERQLHDRFSRKHIDGEWFNLNEKDVQYIKSLEGNVKRPGRVSRKRKRKPFKKSFLGKSIRLCLQSVLSVYAWIGVGILKSAKWGTAMAKKLYRRIR